MKVINKAMTILLITAIMITSCAKKNNSITGSTGGNNNSTNTKPPLDADTAFTLFYNGNNQGVYQNTYGNDYDIFLKGTDYDDITTEENFTNKLTITPTKATTTINFSGYTGGAGTKTITLSIIPEDTTKTVQKTIAIHAPLGYILKKDGITREELIAKPYRTTSDEILIQDLGYVVSDIVITPTGTANAGGETPKDDSLKNAIKLSPGYSVSSISVDSTFRKNDTDGTIVFCDIYIIISGNGEEYRYHFTSGV